MHYIVMDLEWNQPTSFNTPVFRQIGDSLLFEVIQIGAVKLGDDFSVLGELSIPIRPTHYVDIHPRVRRMNISTTELRREAKERNVTVTTLLLGCLMMAAKAAAESHGGKKKIQVQLPANMDQGE